MRSPHLHTLDSPASNSTVLPRHYAWFNAITSGDHRLLEDLFAHGLPIDTLHPLRHTTALMEACRLGSIDTVEWLLAHGASAALLCGMPQGSALHCALRRARLEIAELLLDHIDNAALIDAYGATPLHALCIGLTYQPHNDAADSIARALLAKSCPPNEPDREGVTALHLCAIHDIQPMARTLLELGARPNVATPDTYVTPLMIAALERNTAIMALLLEYGADPHHKNLKGQSPAQIYPAMMKLLKA